MASPIKSFKPDNKGGIYLDKLTEGVNGFAVTVNKYHHIILDPLVEVSPSEKWLFNNKLALESVKQGIEDVKEGGLYDLGSFAQHVDDDNTESTI